MPTDEAAREAILRLACDVPCFTAKQIDNWWGEAKEKKNRRDSQRLRGALPLLKTMVKEGLLHQEQLPNLTMDFHKDTFLWRPGESPPNFQQIEFRSRVRTVQFQRLSWRLSPRYEFSEEIGFFPALQALKEWEPKTYGDTLKNLTIYRATAATLSRPGQPIFTEDSLANVKEQFATRQPVCNCHEDLHAAIRTEIKFTSETRGLAHAAYYLYLIGLGRQRSPDSPFGAQLPVDFERNWQGTGQLEIYSIMPDAFVVLPQFGRMVVAVALGVWCAHGAEAFHSICDSLAIPYLLC